MANEIEFEDHELDDEELPAGGFAEPLPDDLYETFTIVTGDMRRGKRRK